MTPARGKVTRGGEKAKSREAAMHAIFRAGEGQSSPGFNCAHFLTARSLLCAYLEAQVFFHQRQLAACWSLPASQKVKAGIRYLLQLCICYSRTCSNSTTGDHISLFYHSSFDALITNISAKLWDTFTNNKQITKP